MPTLPSRSLIQSASHHLTDLHLAHLCLLSNVNFKVPIKKSGFYIPPAQVNNPDLTRKEREMWNIIAWAVGHLGIIITVDVLFHFMYILTIPSDLKLVKQLTDWTLGEQMMP